MKRAGTAVLALVLLAAAEVAGQGQPRLDRGKGSLEAPAKAILARSHAPAAQPATPAPTPKTRIENPTKALLARRAASAPAVVPPAVANPKVQPGKVTWHRTFADACAASGRSGKPVLLFHLMGKLDDQFC